MFSPDLVRCTTARSCLLHFLLIALPVFWVLPASAAPKTDTILLKNGDRLTGEVKSMKRGRLTLNTDVAGNIELEWDKISSIVSKQHIQIEVVNGTRYFGSLSVSEKGSIIVVNTDDGPQSLDQSQIIAMEPIEGRGIHALDIEVAVGYNFSNAGSVEQANMALNMDWRSLIRIESLRLSTTTTDSDTLEASKRANLGLQHTRLWNNRWFSTGFLSFDRNDELGLNLRSSIGFGSGRYIVQSNKMVWSLEATLQFSREDQVDVEEDVDSLEASFIGKFDWFLFQDPEFDWSTMLQITPSLTESGRVRGEFDTTLKWELINDLKWGFSLYVSYDNQGQAETGSSTDHGINTSLTYEF